MARHDVSRDGAVIGPLRASEEETGALARRALLQRPRTCLHPLKLDEVTDLKLSDFGQNFDGDISIEVDRSNGPRRNDVETGNQITEQGDSETTGSYMYRFLCSNGINAHSKNAFVACPPEPCEQNVANC